MRLWDFASGNCLAVVKKHTRWVKVVRFSNDSRFVASAGLDRKIFIWDTKLMMNAKNVTYSRCIDAHTDTVLDMAVGRLGHLISTSRDCTVRIFDFQSGHEQHCIELGSSWCCSLSVSTDGEYFATGSFDNSVNIYKTKTGEQIRNLRVFNLGTICVRFPRDLEYVVVGSTEGLLQQLPL